MKTFFKEILTSILATLVFAVILCGIYPVIIWGAAQLLFPHQANGSLVESKDLRIIGSEWLGQNFTGAKYFHPRPSAAGAMATTPQAPVARTSDRPRRSLIDAVKATRGRSTAPKTALPADALVPGDAVTASGSGLDPHISVKNAELQAPRVAKERGLSLDAVKAEIAKATDGRSLGILGEPGVNVLKLNIALDNAAAH